MKFAVKVVVDSGSIRIFRGFWVEVSVRAKDC